MVTMFGVSGERGNPETARSASLLTQAWNCVVNTLVLLSRGAIGAAGTASQLDGFGELTGAALVERRSLVPPDRVFVGDHQLVDHAVPGEPLRAAGARTAQASP